MAFAEILGHDKPKALLVRALQSGRLPAALLLAGPEGVGKKTLALAVARALLCAREGGVACGSCSSCDRISRGLHPDVRLVQPAPTAIKIEQVRELVREITGGPFEGRARAFVVDDAHLMTEEASNALLKSLEEPPPTSHVLLVTSAPQALLPTIRSRCQMLRLGPLPASLIEAHLRESVGIASEDAHLRASLAGGSLAAAMAFESEAYRALREQLIGLLEKAAASGPLERMEEAERLAEHDDPALALTILRSLLRDLVALRSGVEPARALNRDVAPRLGALAQGGLGARATALLDVVGETRFALRGNANKMLSMDLLLDALGSDAA